jgi:hypothetical protein
MNWMIADGNILAMKEIERMGADEYYSTINTFLMVMKEREKEELKNK